MRQFFGRLCGTAFSLNNGLKDLRLTLASVFALMFFLGIPTTVFAQVQEIPSVVVVDLTLGPKVKSGDLGRIAAEELRLELAKVGSSDVIAYETIKRALEDLGQEGIPTDRATLTRLGQTLGASSIVVGEVLEARIDAVGGGSQARILIKIQMRDVASGLAINGAQVIGNSGVRTGDVSEETMFSDACKAAAFEAAREMSARQLPSATVLNTLPKSALINKGSRAGFKAGMEVIIVRGKEQVGTATVSGVDADSAFINYGKLIKGIQPGDKVRTLYTPEREFKGITSSGKPKATRAARGGSNSGLVSLLLVLVALGFLLGQGRGSDLTLARVTTQATVTAQDQPAVVVSWTRDAFLRGNHEGPWQWQVWRNDGSATPVAVTDGIFGFVIDDALGTNSGLWYNLEDQTSSTECDDAPALDTAIQNLLVPGTPYLYTIGLIYRVSPLSIPGSPAGAEWCYFRSQKILARGLSTPLVRPELRSPDPDQIVTTPNSFQFTSVRGAVTSIVMEYAVQISDRFDFPGNRTITFTPFQEFIEVGGATLSSPTFDTTTFFIGSNDIYWRVGARNVADVPGPLKDATTGQRLVFSAVRRFRRIEPPPFGAIGG